MRKIGVLVMVAALLVACNQTSNEPPAQATLQTEDVEITTVQHAPDQDASFLLEAGDQEAAEGADQYVIHAELDAENMTLTGRQSITYMNRESAALDFLVVHVYPNAYRTQETSPALFGDLEAIYPDGFKPGYTDITSLQVNGKDAQWSLKGKDQTVLRIQLEDALQPERTLEIEMEWVLQIPPSLDRLGYGEKHINFGNWYPIMAVYDHQGWNEDAYYKIGDPFYSEVANYDVTLIIPDAYTVASTGILRSLDHQGGERTWRYEAKLMRDFAFVLGKGLNMTVQEQDGVLVRNYYFGERDLTDDVAEKASVQSVKAFNQLFGDYPYRELAVVETGFPSGMEYPGMVMISEDYYRFSRTDRLAQVIIHEIGHQWWYGVVGNDEVDESWLDESLTVYSEALYADVYTGEDGYEGNVNYWLQRYNDSKSDISDLSIDRSVTEFEGWYDYGTLVYRKGALFMDALKDEFGREATISFLQKYYEENRLGVATTEKFLDLGQTHFGDPFMEIANDWLYTQ